MSIGSYRLLTIITSIWLVVYSHYVSALIDDRNQPIYISADKAQKNNKKGTTLYEGNVVITQGSIRVEGDKITIVNIDGEIEKITAIGQPASFKQKSEMSTDYIVAKGLRIEFNLQNEFLLLQRHAVLKREGRITESNQITYDMRAGIVEAGGDGNGGVTMVFSESKSTKSK